ncbi:tail fiber domain-containing protein [Peptostreptococcus anaerobius]|uniref:tail fiber domain-containing protein n=1 Tax=Peptostreptococcus anaerobius TaxID=1261 RepID=UPI003D701DAB
MKLIKEAFAEPSRELSCNITIGDTVYNDDFIENFKIVKGLSEAKDFEVGTAFMSSINLKMVDKLGEFNKAAFKDKTCKVEIGVKTSQGVGFVKVGEYFIDSVGSDKASWTLKGYDKMCKFNVKYDCKLDFPTTLKSVVLDICKMCGVEPSSGIKSSTGVLNKTIKYKPNFYEMTCREVLAQVAELCCGWAYIDTETQKLEICSGYSSDSDIKINDDNLIVFKELKSSTNSDTKIQIDSVKIIQKGADDADYNANSPRKFHIIDNIWIQGNGHEFLDYATKSYNFSELSALSIKYNGNPALENNKFVAVNRAGKIYRFLPLVRRLTYNGGLVEECECPQINYDPTNRRKDLVRHIEKISATLRVMDEKIQAKVGTEEFATLVEQTKEEIKALAKSINLTGYVKFEDLKKVNGTTEINGGNITTGVIQSRDGGFGIDLDNKTFFLGRDLEHYALLFDGRNLKFGAGGIKSEHFSEGLKQELKGKDGQSQYVHTRYSDTGGTTGAMFIEPSSEFGEPHKYIGFAITSNKGAPALKSAYTWSKYIGEDGSKGSPGEPGTDGKTPYFHIAWADNESGSSGFTTSGGNDKAYMGTYTDFTERDSDDYRKYTWVKVKGDDGKDGRPGRDGKPGRDGRDGERGAQGPPGRDGRDGRDGSMVDLPPALKDWSGKATEISGKYVFTPELFVGTNGDSMYSRTGIYVGSGIRARNLWGEFANFDGITGINNGTATWHLSVNGNGWIGNSQRAMWWNKDGELTLPKVKAREIEAGAITTDILYPGLNNRIVLESGYKPGDNDCMSIDTNTDSSGKKSLRLKVNAGTYLRLSKDSAFSFLSRGSTVFHFDPRQQYDLEFFGDRGRGTGKFNMYDAYIEAKCYEGQVARMGIVTYEIQWSTSDKRLKTDIEYLSESMVSNLTEFIKKLNIAEFYFKSDEKKEHKQISVIAQDIIKEFPELKNYIVNEVGEYYTVNSNNINFATIVTLQEEIKKREELESKVNKLENELEEIKKLLKKEGGVNA